jgi:hypothetical protein
MASASAHLDNYAAAVKGMSLFSQQFIKVGHSKI